MVAVLVRVSETSVSLNTSSGRCSVIANGGGERWLLSKLSAGKTPW